jgi:hypothetical protein
MGVSRPLHVGERFGEWRRWVGDFIAESGI